MGNNDGCLTLTIEFSGDILKKEVHRYMKRKNITLLILLLGMLLCLLTGCIKDIPGLGEIAQQDTGTEATEASRGPDYWPSNEEIVQQITQSDPLCAGEDPIVFDASTLTLCSDEEAEAINNYPNPDLYKWKYYKITGSNSNIRTTVTYCIVVSIRPESMGDVEAWNLYNIYGLHVYMTPVKPITQEQLFDDFQSLLPEDGEYRNLQVSTVATELEPERYPYETFPGSGEYYNFFMSRASFTASVENRNSDGTCWLMEYTLEYYCDLEQGWVLDGMNAQIVDQYPWEETPQTQPTTPPTEPTEPAHPDDPLPASVTEEYIVELIRRTWEVENYLYMFRQDSVKIDVTTLYYNAAEEQVYAEATFEGKDRYFTHRFHVVCPLVLAYGDTWLFDYFSVDYLGDGPVGRNDDHAKRVLADDYGIDPADITVQIEEDTKRVYFYFEAYDEDFGGFAKIRAHYTSWDLCHDIWFIYSTSTY